MNPEDDEIEAELDAIEAGDAEPIRGRRIVMGETSIEAGGPTTYDPSGEHIVQREERSPAERGKRPASGPTREQRARWEVEQGRDESGAEVGAYGDLASLVNPMAGEEGHRSGARTAERILRLRDQLTLGDARLGGRNPIRPIVGRDRRAEAPIAGLVDATTLGTADEFAGMVARDSSVTDRLRERSREAREQAPEAFSLGETAGSAAIAAVPMGAVGEGASLTRHALHGARQGALMGALSGAGHSDETTAPGVLLDAGQGGLQGAALGAAGGAAGGALRRRSPAEIEALSAQRDDALLAATGHAGHNRGAVEAFDFGDTPAQIRASRARAAQVLRDTGAVPTLGTTGQTREAIDQAMGRTTQTMQDVQTAMGSRGPTGEAIAPRLRERAASRRGVGDEPYRDVMADQAERYGGVVDEATGAVTVPEGQRSPTEPIDYRALMDETEALRGRGAWRTRAGRDVPLSERARRDVDRTLRDAYDDEVGAQLGGVTDEGGAYRSQAATPEQSAARQRLGADPRSAYQQARQRFAVLRTAQENAQRGEAAAAGNRGVGMSEMQWGNTGAEIAGAPGAAVGSGVARAWRAVEPRVRAAWAERVYQMARRDPSILGEYARPLIAAASRGAPALLQAHDALVSQDAEYRELMQAIEDADANATPSGDPAASRILGLMEER